MNAILEYESGRFEEEAFQDFFRSFERDVQWSKYRRRLTQVATSQSRSLVIDFDDLVDFDSNLARKVLERSDEYIDLASRAATAQLRVADADYAQKIGSIHARFRFRRLPERTPLRGVGAEHLEKLILVDGIVVRSTQVRPMVVRAAYRCLKCAQVVREEEAGELVRGLGGTCPHCKQRTVFELIQSESEFRNTQEVRVQERPEDLPPGQLPRYLDVRLEDDLVDTARPGDRVGLTALVRAERPSETGEARGRTFNLYLEANYVDVAGKEAELVEITSEEEQKILEAAKDPWIHRNLVRSLAPSIHGYEDIKEAVLYILLGGVQKQLPDRIRIRGDINGILIGDPGCLVGDERIVLGDGTITRMDELGRDHLQDIQIQVLTGEGGAKRDLATRFHLYRSQPTIEIVTESGKSIRGTCNHPLLAVETINRTLARRWKRLDELRVGDRVAVVTGFPCTITNHITTGWHPLRYKRGPRFRGKLPPTVTHELAALLGYILGDGFVQRYRIGFTVAEGEKDILQPLCGLSEKLFGIRPRVSSGKRKNRKVTLHEAVIGSQDIAKNLEFLRQKRVPSLIFRSGNEVLSSFLRWLYEADGTVFTAKRGCGAIGLKARDLELLRDVQILLLRFGVHSRILGNALLTRRGESILKFAEKIGFASAKKRSRLADLVERALRLKRLTRQRSERIVAIHHREPADVYDIEVPRTHRFIANGIVSHNTAKSQLLQYVAKIAPRGLYTSGRGSTAAGLTAAVLREKTGGMVLEAGALVLADKGIACIDEIDKMREDDRVAIHEALEQQTVSVAKGGIVATLNARAAVLAAGNPQFGRYVPERNLTENINLPVTILSRFDLIFIIRDQPEPETDSRMSEHILALHRTQTHPEAAAFPPDFLRKYISYAKRITPILTQEASDEIRDFYLNMRAKSGTEGAITITPRQLEGLIRISEARARAFLRNTVTIEDAKGAIRIMRLSLGDAGLDVKTGAMDIDVIMTGKPRSQRDTLQRIFTILQELERETGNVEETVLVNVVAEREKIDDRESRRLIGILVRDGMLYSPKPGILKRTRG